MSKGDTIRRIVVDASSADRAASQVNQAAAAVGHLDARTSSMVRSAANLAGGLLTAGGLVQGLKFAVEGAAEAEAAGRRLETAWGRDTTALNAYAQSVQARLAIEDDAAISAMALISAHTKSEEAVKALTAAAADMSVALGMDLDSAARMLGKTLGSNVNVLKRSGVEVEGAVGSMERLKSITEGVSRLWGGQAAAAAETMTGQMNAAKIAFGNAAESLGVILAPALKGAAGLIQETAGFWQDFLDSLSSKASSSEQAAIRVTQAVTDLYGKAGAAGAGELKALDGISLRTVDLATLVKLANAAQQESNRLLEESTTAGAIKGQQLENSADLYREYARAVNALVTARNDEMAVLAAEAEMRGRKAPAMPVAGETDEERAARLAAAEAEWAAWEENMNKMAVALGMEEEAYDKRQEAIAKLKEGDAAWADQVAASTETHDDWVAAQLDAAEAAAQEYEWREAFIEQFPREAAALGMVSEAEKKAADAAEKRHEAQQKNLKAASQMAGALASMNQAFKGSAQVTRRMMQAQAVIDTYAAANSALATVKPFPLALIMAATAIITGLANVAQIQAQAFARGGDFVTTGPRLILVGDNPGGQERVQVTPISSPNYNGPGRSVNVSLVFNGPVTAREWVQDELLPIVRRELERELA